MLVCLENAYSRLFLGFLGGTFLPNDVTHYPYPKKDHPWAEPRHLSHKLRIFSYRLLNGHYKSPLHVFPLV